MDKNNPDVVDEKVAAQRARHRESMRQYREKHPEYMKNYYQTHRDQFRKNDKKYRDAHRGSRKEYFKEYYEQNKDKLIARTRERYEQNGDAVKPRIAKWRAKNPEKVRQYGIECKKKRSEKLKQQREIIVRKMNDDAKSVCPAYIFLAGVRTENLATYTIAYNPRERVVPKAAKSCDALYLMDVRICPLVARKITGAARMSAKCPMSDAFKIPGAANEIMKIAKKLREKCRG